MMCHSPRVEPCPPLPLIQGVRVVQEPHKKKAYNKQLGHLKAPTIGYFVGDTLTRRPSITSPSCGLTSSASLKSICSPSIGKALGGLPAAENMHY